MEESRIETVGAVRCLPELVKAVAVLAATNKPFDKNFFFSAYKFTP